MVNPFVIKSYESKEFFCDREEELQLMLQNCINKTDMTLVSRRRMGKTGLVFRLFELLHVNAFIRNILHLLHLLIRNRCIFIEEQEGIQNVDGRLQRRDLSRIFVRVLRKFHGFGVIAGLFRLAGFIRQIVVYGLQLRVILYHRQPHAARFLIELLA